MAQMTVKMYFEPMVEPIFHSDSYGYRPGKSAIDAVRVTRTRCWRHDWVLEFDIKGLFDNIDHGLLMKYLALFVLLKPDSRLTAHLSAKMMKNS
ncbi:reverse transcriptase domain-containing protein [Paenibacillus alginolyticus]